jgi:hypothetical protein
MEDHMDDITKSLLSATQAAALLGVSPPTFATLAAENPDVLPHVSVVPTGRMWRFEHVWTFLLKRDADEKQRRLDLLRKWGSNFEGVDATK